MTVEGLPVLFIKDLPPVSSVSLRVTRPQIYYGEIANEYVFVGTRQREFDHPSGEANVYAAYKGTGGVRVGNLWRRLLLAVRFGSSKILLSRDITNDSRVLYHRNIVERARKALPFLRFDRDPYMVIAGDGTLKWILDAYTTTNGYPYAQRLIDGTSYMRNSVKLVIDAYDGSLTAYVSAPTDPLIRTWARIFPGIFAPLDSMPADLRAHLRYPDDIYRVQTGLYTTYHMDAPEDFYHREDQWQIPQVTKADESVPFMRHIIMRLPEESKAEFIYMVPFTPRGKDNLAAWMVARNDGDVYGKLLVYRLSRQSLVFGPQQIENRINQNTEIARQVSLWDQRGSRVIRGDLLVIPIEESLVYVQPLYLQAEGGPDSRAQAGDRRVPEPGGDAGDAGGRPGRALRRLQRRATRADGPCKRGRGRRDGGRGDIRHGDPRAGRRGLAPVPGGAGGESASGLGPLRRGVPAAGRGAGASPHAGVMEHQRYGKA